MKNVSIVLLLLAGSVAGYSQEWKTNLNEALKEASASGKEVLLFFSVPDNCESCANLDKKVLQSAEFQSFADENFILVKQDFQSNDSNLEENLLIVEKYNKDGFFPLLVMINKNAKIVGQLGTYNNETPQQYIAKLRAVRKG
ncbi:thioredoxin family protein [Flavobacterium sp.]|uniref:thioredoxin family protein n=1 Tax=Flavobacterium sp. TaxID=239 RepID=UPI0039E25DEA